MPENPVEARQKRTQFWKSAPFRWAAFVPLLILFVLAYVKIGGLLITQTNNTPKDMFGGDQMHNMRLATQARDDLHPDFSKGFSKSILNLFPHRTDGVVQPLWPWISAWFTDNDHKITEEQMQSKVPTEKDIALFNKGRWFHVTFTAVFLVMLGIAACRTFSFPAALNLLLLGGFGALLPRAAYFQPEPVYFVFFFLTWVACVSALTHNSLWIYGLIGVLAGIAYLAKGSVEPLLMVFIGVSTLRSLWEYFSAKRRGFVLSPTNLWYWRNHMLGVLILGITYLMTVGPRLTDSQEKFGSMFHSYPGYWMWMDRFEPDCYEWMDKHNTRAELEAMLPADKPSLGKYLRTHSREEFLNRLADGTKVKLTEFLVPKQTKRSDKIENQKPWKGVFESRGIYLGALAAVLLTLVVILMSAAPRAEHAGHVVFRHGTVTIVLFTLGAFSLYSLAYGFYTPIGRGERFMMSLYLPLVFSFVWGAESIVRRIQRRQGSVWIARGYWLAQWLLVVTLVWRLVEILRTPHFYNG